MHESAVRDYILEWVKKELPSGVPRELEVSRRKNKVISIIGPRRAGKTYFLYQQAQRERDISLLLNFEDTRLIDVDFMKIRQLIRIYVETAGKEPTNLFFDEIQNIRGWERAVRELLDLRRYHIFVTGSSSKLLSREIATQLRGRSFSYLLLPFSFREYLRAKGKEISAGGITLDESARVRNLLKDYLEFGGFPEVVFEESEKERILKEYSEMILFRDVVERHKIKNIGLARFLLSFMFQNFSKEMSVRRLVKSSGLKRASVNTFYNYIDKIQDSVAVFFLNRFSQKAHLRESWPKKIYLCDTGLSKVVKFSEDLGKLMENCVFLELLRKTNKKPLLEIYYWKNSHGETDFLLKEGTETTQLIQVTYASGIDEIDGREIKALLKASEQTRCKDMLIITWDCEDLIKKNEKAIKLLPLWKWLLKSEQEGPRCSPTH